MKSQQYQNFYNLSKHFNNYYIDQTNVPVHEFGKNIKSIY